MPAVLAKRCKSTAVGTYHVESHTEVDKSYYVNLDPVNGNTCTCIAFAMKRNRMGGNSAIGQPDCTCKHIEALLATRNGCGWDSETGIKQEYPAICPVCYDDVTEYDTRDVNSIDMEELLADFKNLSAKLKAIH